MEKIKIRLYNDSDAQSVVDLLCNNNFYLAKYAPNLTVERFLDIQKKRGMLFTVLAVKGEIVVATLSVYKSGCQRIAKQNEVYISSFLVDKKYRHSFFTLFDMFSFMLEETIKKGFGIITAEVTYDNEISLHLLRKVGFVLLDGKRDIYNNVVLHNYVYGLMKMLDFQEAFKKSIMQKFLIHSSQKNILVPNPQYNDSFVWQTYKLSCGVSDVLFDIHTGYAVGIKVDGKFSFYPMEDNLNCYIISNMLANKCKFYIGSEESLVELEMDSHTQDSIVVQSGDISLCIKDDNINEKFYFSNLGNRKQNIKTSLCEVSQNLQMDFETGTLILCNKHRENRIRELWPSLTSPCLLGSLVPNELHEPRIEHIDEKTTEITVDLENVSIKRKYYYDDYSIIIDTYYEEKHSCCIEPIYQFVLDDLNYACKFLDNDDNVLFTNVYDASDRNSYTEEAMFEDFKAYNSNNKNANKVIIEYYDKKYHIEFPNETQIFINSNCIIGRQDIKRMEEKTKNSLCYLGKIVIKI